MNIQSETYSIDVFEPGFVHVHQVRVKDNGKDIGGHIWFERANLGWVVDTLRACVGTYAFPETATRAGDDSLKVFESGHEQAPVINLFNVRPDGAPHGGVFARTFGKPVAERLVEDLAAIA